MVSLNIDLTDNYHHNQNSRIRSHDGEDAAPNNFTIIPDFLTRQILD